MERFSWASGFVALAASASATSPGHARSHAGVGRGAENGPTGPAAIAGSAHLDDPKPRRHIIEHFADGFTDQVQLAATARARR
jgi:hypothetical protein